MRDDDFDREFQETWNRIGRAHKAAARWAWLGGVLWLIGVTLGLASLALVVYILARFAGLI